MKRATLILVARRAFACIALIGAAQPALADPRWTECLPDEALPEFVTRRIELQSAIGSAPSVELAPGCLRGVADPMAPAGGGRLAGRAFER